ncbi:MAG: FG-GAP-like repeat-containing protein [Thermogutta sp.]
MSTACRRRRGRFESLEPRYLLSGDYFWFTEGPLAVGTSPQSVALADVNGDGILDLITAHDATSQVRVRLGNGDGTFGDAAIYGVGGQAYGLAISDLNQDGSLDILVSLRFEDRLAVLLGDGDGNFTLSDPITTGDYPTAIAVADFDADGRPDIVTADHNGGTLSVILASSEGGFQPAVSYSSGNAPFAVKAGDINGDGILDLISVNSYSRTLAILLGRGDGTFGSAITYSLGVFPYAVAVGDVNGDSALDVVVTNMGNDNVQVFLNNGSGELTAGAVINTKDSPGPIALVDVNVDGRLDIAVACSNQDVVQVFLGAGDGSFTLWREANVGLYPTDLAFGDINGDGRVDLVTANYDGNSVSILLQQLDTQPPISYFTSVPTEAWGLPVTLSWAGDDQGGSGVASYNVWYRRVGETAYTLWLANTSTTSAAFQAEPGYSYELVVTASDIAGNLEPLPDVPKATITLTVKTVDFLVISDVAAGSTLYPIKTSQGGVLTILAAGLNPSAGQRVELYNASQQLVATSRTEGENERIDVTAAGPDEIYYVKISGENVFTTLTLVNLVAVDGQHVTVSGTPGVEWLVVTPETRELAINGVTYAWPTGDAIVIEAHGLGGNDWAQLYDSQGDDVFTAKPGESRMEGPGYQIIVYDYFAVHGYAKTGSGNDIAHLFDSAGHEVVSGTSNFLRVRGDSFILRAKFFGEVSISSTGGDDRLKLLGSEGNDTLSLTDDTIQFHTGNQIIKTNIFSNIFISGGGGDDVATLDTGEDLVLLDATEERLRLLAPDVPYVLRIRGFESITARNQNPASTKKVASAVDYLMLEGTWA